MTIIIERFAGSSAQNESTKHGAIVLSKIEQRCLFNSLNVNLI